MTSQVHDFSMFEIAEFKVQVLVSKSFSEMILGIFEEQSSKLI